MRVVITGVTGLLGRYLLQSNQAQHTVLGVSLNSQLPDEHQIAELINVDLAVPGAGTAVLERLQPDAVIHAAGEGRVDAVEGRMPEHWQLNVGTAKEIAQYCGDRTIPLAFLSSNAVFGGSTLPYADSSQLDPINDYGRLKAEAEREVQATDAGALVVRPLLMYGLPYPTGRLNPALHWVRELSAGKVVRVVDDVRTQPLWALDCARCIWRGLERGLSGPLNISGGQSLTLYEFALLTAEVFGLDPGLVQPIASSSLTMLAPRPMDTAFDLGRVHEELDFIPSTPRQGLQALRAEYLTSQAQPS